MMGVRKLGLGMLFLLLLVVSGGEGMRVEEVEELRVKLEKSGYSLPPFLPLPGSEFSEFGVASHSQTPSSSSSSSPSGPSSPSRKKRQEDKGDRPQLKNSRVLPLDAFIANEKYEYILSTLEFDQDIYLNEPLVCPRQENNCSYTCTPCDWTGETNTGCSDPTCCGAAQDPTSPTFNHTADWCNSSLPPFTKINFNEKSEVFQLQQDETKFFRFFVGEEEACRSILIEAHIHFGHASLQASHFLAYPTPNSLSSIENGKAFFAGSALGGINYGSASVTLCPNVNPSFGPGTWAFALTGLEAKNTELTVTVHLGEEKYPIAPPEDRFSCADFPPEEFDDIPVFSGSADDVGGHYCLEEGVTISITSVLPVWYDMVLPVQPGCHEISLAVNGNTDPSGQWGSSFLFYCGQSTAYENDGDSALSHRSEVYVNYVYFSACFDELTYVHCSVLASFPTPFPSNFVWTTNPPVRNKISEVNPGHLSSWLGLTQAGALHPDLDFNLEFRWSGDGYAWITQPSESPLAFYPPYATFAYNYSEAPIDAWVDGGFSEPKGNIVSIVDLTTIKNKEVRNRDLLLQEGFLFTLGLTSATGLPVELCNDDDFKSGKCGRGNIPVKNTWTDFMPTRTFSSLNVGNGRDCDNGLYDKETELIRQITSGDSTTIDEIAQKSYLSNIYDAGLPRALCENKIESYLESDVDNITKYEKNYCPYPVISAGWQGDVCCNNKMKVVDCCAPQLLNLEDELYTESDTNEVEDTCYHSDCDESFFTDIAASLNSMGSPLIGCASGLGDPGYELSVVIERELASFYRPCLVQAGYGDLFQGVKCSIDVDCENLDTTCDVSAGKCRPGASQVRRDMFFDCFMENMPPKVEDYIRYKILPSPFTNLPKDSEAFSQEVKKSASQMDCVPREEGGENGLEVGERYVTDVPLGCKTLAKGVPNSMAPLIAISCPEYVCRGERACRYGDAKECGFDVSFSCHATREYIGPSLSSCPVDDVVCNSNYPSPVVDDTCDGYVCALCLSETEPCVIVDGVTSEEDCERLTACELADGSFRYDLSRQECEDLIGECTSDCAGQSCRSLDGVGGVCGVIIGGGGDCGSMGGFVGGDGACYLPGVGDLEGCEQVADLLGGTAEWSSCADMDVTACSNHTTFDFPYLYLKCYIDEFQDCNNREECEASGSCTDVDFLRQVIPTETWFTVTYGLCLTSGLDAIGTEPECSIQLAEYYNPYGCQFRPATDEAYCLFWGSPANFIYPHWTVWLTPAYTEETCRTKAYGRFGCYLPDDYRKSFYFWNETACECLQGTSDYYFDWTPGIWKGGKPHSLTWLEREDKQKYTWEETISFVTMENWVSRAVETLLSYELESELLCETNYASSSLSTLVCDCVGDGVSCFPSNIETEVGVMKACTDDLTVLKGPSSFTTFSTESIKELCTEATLSLIQRSWFLFPPSSTAVSFQFANRKDRGIVLNEKMVTVGEVVGDGSKILFRNPDRVKMFSVCLLIAEDTDQYKDQYPSKDFGIPQDDNNFILPMGLKEVEERKVELYTYWCAEIEEDMIWDDGSVTFFPVVRLEDYQSKEENSLSHRTKSLLYTLAACYIFDLLLLSTFFVVVFKRSFTYNKGIPAVTWLGIIFAIVCVFRIVFCFVYVEDGFSELSEYIIFEIPTFLLFSAVILVICLFVRLSKKKGFDFKSQDKKLWVLGITALILVWSLFIIVTVIYAEVILEQEEESTCPGRVKASNDDIEDDTRTLSIVYQAIVIAFTLLLSLVFLRQALILFKMTKKSQNAKVFVFRISSVIISCFLLRCILFIILLSIDLTSDIYLFITLFLTEVVMMFFIAIEVNKNFYGSMVSNITGGTTMGSTKKGSGGSIGSGVSVGSGSLSSK